MYVLVADDTDAVYTSEHEWTPQLYPYQQAGANVLFLTFLNPAKMPAVPPAFANLAKSRGQGTSGAVSNETTIMFAIGGQAYSDGSCWSWLTSSTKAEAMAAEVALWPENYGCDGIDLDIETGAGSSDAAGENLAIFVAKLKELAPNMIVTQPVFGSPSQVPAANRMLEAAYNSSKGSKALGSLSKVGIMVYSGTGAEQFLDNYVHGCDHCTVWYCAIDACVPTSDMVLGASGAESASTISTLAQDVNSQGLGGIMVWYASLLDPSTGSGGLMYGNMDASTQGLDAWRSALVDMTGHSPPTPPPTPPTPTPTPPTPTPTPPSPTPPAPSPAPSPMPPAGPIMGFWDGWVGSHSSSAAPATGWFFSFPGVAVSPPFTGTPYNQIVPPPTWGTYDKLILTQGGGDTGWGDSFYARLQDQLDQYKPAGWDGVCWDWETAGSDHTTEGFNALMNATKNEGLLNILTSTAEGPYMWSASSNDATGIDWSLIDYFVPQMYGASGTLPSAWETYAQYWVDGAGKPTIHDVTFAAIPMEKILWGMPSGTCSQAEKFGGSGCIEWAYSPAVNPSMQV